MPRCSFYYHKNTLWFVLFFLLGNACCLGAQSEGFAGRSPYGKVIREIRIQGLRNTRESVVRDQLASQVGHIYTQKTAKDDYRWLERLRVFTSIHTSPAVVEDAVVLTIEVQELPIIVPFPTLNITRTNGASGGLGVGTLNLMNSAVSLSGSTKFGGLTEVDVSLKAPWRLRSREWYRASYDYRDRKNKHYSYRENSHELDIRIGISPRPDWMLSGKFGFMSMGSDTPGITLSPGNRDSIPALGAIVEYDGLDSAAVPREGWKGIFDITQNGGFLGGDGNFMTTQLDIRRYQPLADRHTLVLFSYITFQSGEVEEDVPVYRGYQIGGANTVRGWDSDARLGNNQFVNTLEYRYELVPPKSFRVYKYSFSIGLQLAGFADLGTAWTHGSEFTRNMIAGGGIGLRVLVPFLDTIRMDFGIGQSGTGIHPHLHIREKAHYSRNRIR